MLKCEINQLFELKTQTNEFHFIDLSFKKVSQNFTRKNSKITQLLLLKYKKT